MANIALDIRANTQKALGEFKKLSRELDNKFLVQGLKLDVVKDAFKQINREFDNALGDQGLRTAETTGQLQRSLGQNLVALRKFGREGAEAVSNSVKSALLDLQAQGKITGEVVKDAFNVAGLLDFEGTAEERKQQFTRASTEIAQFLQKTEFLFGDQDQQTSLAKKALSGQLTVQDLLNIDTEAGGVGNEFKTILLKYSDALRSVDPTTRTRAYLAALREYQNSPEFQKDLFAIAPIRAVFLELRGLFSPKGVFGAIRAVGEEIGSFDDPSRRIPRNVLNTTGILLRTIFDKDEGLFAELFKALQDVFGSGFDPLEPILTGIEFFTDVVESIRDFFASPAFRNLLGVFEPLKEAIGNIESQGLVNITPDEINGVVDGVFDSVRLAFNKLASFIRNIDVSTIGSIVGNLVTEIVKTLPSLINVAVAAIGKAIQALGAILSKIDGGQLGAIFAVVISGIGELILKAIPVVLIAIGKAFQALVGAFTESGIVGKALIVGTFASFISKVFGGPGLISLIRDKIGAGFNSLFRGGKDGQDARAVRGLRGFEASVISRLNTIIKLLGGRPGADPFGDGPGRGPRGGPGGTPRRPPTRAAQERFRRRFGDRAFRQRFRNPVRSGARFRLASRVARRQGGRLLDLGTRFTQPITQALGGLRSQLSQFRAGFGTTAKTARGFNVAVGAASPGRAFNIGQGLRRLPNTIARSFRGVSSRIADLLARSGRSISSLSTTATTALKTLFTNTSSALSRSFSGLSTRLSSLLQRSGSSLTSITRAVTSRIGIIFNAAARRISSISTAAAKATTEVAKKAPQIATRVANVAGRVAGAAGGVAGGIARGAGAVARGAGNLIKNLPKGGIITALLGGFAIADILGRKTDASELEGLTPEEKRERKRQDERSKTRGVLGVLSGIGGGALAGAGVGAALGAAGANPFTVAVGGILGSIVGGIIGEEAVNVLGDNIIDGVTEFAKSVGGFFSGLWSNVTGFFGGAFENVKGFFGNIAKWFTDLPENIGKSLSNAWSSISSTLADLPASFFGFLLGPIGYLAKPLIDRLAGKDVNKEERVETVEKSLGGRVNFNEKGTGEFGILPNGTTFITPTSMPQVLNAMAGKRGSGEVNNSIVINVNAPGANEFANQLSEQVLQKLEDMYAETQSTL